MAPEPLKQWSTDDVITWLCAIGLGDKADAFKENAVDGNLLSSLSKEDLTGDLGLSSLQAKKVLLEMDFINGLTSGGGGGGADPEEIQRLQQELQEKDAKIADLEAMLQAMKPTSCSRPGSQVSTTATANTISPQHHVARGAAGGAFRGAVGGAVGKSYFESLVLIVVAKWKYKSHSECIRSIQI